MRVRGVVFDVGNVIVRWDPRTLYSKILPDPAERDWFLSRICAMSSTMFMLGLVATDIAMLVIAPCSPW